jgi:hypothetical protein
LKLVRVPDKFPIISVYAGKGVSQHFEAHCWSASICYIYLVHLFRSGGNILLNWRQNAKRQPKCRWKDQFIIWTSECPSKQPLWQRRRIILSFLHTWSELIHEAAEVSDHLKKIT